MSGKSQEVTYNLLLVLHSSFWRNLFQKNCKYSFTCWYSRVYYAGS